MNATTARLNPDPHSFESVVFRMHRDLQFDETDGKDPLLADFVLIHSPVKLILLIAAILVFLKLLEEWMKERDAYPFARPAFLVNCGLTFGVNGCGVLLAIAGERRQLALALPLAHALLLACSAVTDGGGHLFQCLERSHLSLSTIFCRYIMFVYLATLVYDLLSLVLPILQKQRIPNKLLLRQLVWIVTAVIIIRNQPIGFPVFVPLVHSFLKVLHNMLTVMETASKELKPDLKWARRLQLLSVLLHFLMITHQVYFICRSSCLPTWVSSVTAAAAAAQTVSLLDSLSWVQRRDGFSSLILG